MKIYRDRKSMGPEVKGGALTIGNFDGVHLGHQSLIEEVRARAEADAGPAILLTFDPHPGRLLAPKKHPPLLTTEAKKCELVEKTGIDVMVIEPFTEELAGYSPEKFITEIIHSSFEPSQIVLGYDFCFGAERAGNFETVKKYASRFGYEADVVGAFKIDGGIISSSQIRKSIAGGAIADAARCLGRFYSIEGVVISGDHIGRTIGFPTANLAVENELIPADGVYSVFVRVDDQIYPGAASIGVRPTFKDAERSIEVFLLDFTGDLYQKKIEIGFVSRLRDQFAFSGLEQLKEKIAEDVTQIREILNGIPNINRVF